MHDKVIFFAFAVFLAVFLGSAAGAGAVAICYLAGVTGSGLVAAFGATAGAVFTGVVALASLAGKLFFP